MAVVPTVFTIKVAHVPQAPEDEVRHDAEYYNGPLEEIFDPVEEEHNLHVNMAESRSVAFKNIIMNKSTENVPAYVALYGFSGTLLSLATTSLLTLIPLHNLITHPQYWYEVIFPSGIFISTFSAFILLSCSYWMNVDFIRKKKHYFNLFFTLLASVSFCALLSYFIWTYILKYRYPMPFHG